MPLSPETDLHHWGQKQEIIHPGGPAQTQISLSNIHIAKLRQMSVVTSVFCKERETDGLAF